MMGDIKMKYYLDNQYIIKRHMYDFRLEINNFKLYTSIIVCALCGPLIKSFPLRQK